VIPPCTPDQTVLLLELVLCFFYPYQLSAIFYVNNACMGIKGAAHKI
jgi:hypothetical protein